VALTALARDPRVTAVVPEGWELQCESREALLFKNARCVDLDEYFGDVLSAIHDLENSLRRQLEDVVVNEHQDDLYRLGHSLAELDALMSFAEVAADGRWCRPHVKRDGARELFAKNARNPLVELLLEGGGSGSVVPNDVALVPGVRGGGPVWLVTGPNGSGKSCFLRTVGLLPVLAQAGCFVPADKFVFGIVDQVFTRIASLETAAVGMSSFSIDINAIGAMCRHATPASLLLIDEFGKGTSSVDGVALLAATIRFLLRSARREGADAHPPKTIITTHFREVFDYGLLCDAAPPATPAPPAPAAADASSASSSSSSAAAVPFFGPSPPHVSFLQMSVSFERKADPGAAAGSGVGAGVGAGAGAAAGAGVEGVDWAEDAVTPLFKLLPGRAASSYGLSCASRAGVPADAVRRAALVSGHMRRHEPLRRLGEGAGEGAFGGAAAAAAERRDAAALELAELLMREVPGGAEALPTGVASRAVELVRGALAADE